MERVVDPSADSKRQHEELLKTSREAMAQDRKRRDAFEGLLKHPGWKEFQELLNLMIGERSAELLSPAGSVDKMIALEFVKGTMNGLILARDLPKIIIDNVPAATVEDE